MPKTKKLKINGTTFDFGNSPTLLWENLSPSSTFASQTITLSDEVENYDFIGIICASTNGTTGRKQALPMIMVPLGMTDAYMTKSNYRNYARSFSEISGTSITIGNCLYYATYGTNTSSNDNTQIIPRYVYGFNE